MSFLVQTHGMGLDYLRELAGQEPLVLRDERLQVEWMAQGKYAVGIAIRLERVAEFTSAGAPLQYFFLKEGSWLDSGMGNIAILTRPPHPNATIIFVNWLLSREGQPVINEELVFQSAREDVPALYLETERRRQPGMVYFDVRDEKFQLEEADKAAQAKEIFRPLVR